jgi:surfeit locus 1 family protein
VQGRWLPVAPVFLDNRQMDGRPGFFVLSPLQLDRGDVVLVQRGWVPRDMQDRSRLPPCRCLRRRWCPPAWRPGHRP